MTTLANELEQVVHNYAKNRPRTQQSNAGILGISDVGGCREYARLRTIGVEGTDDRTLWAATVGTAIHVPLGEAIKEAYGDDVLVEHKVTCTYPSGAELPGTADAVVPKRNLVLDWKTLDGLQLIAKKGPSNQQWKQVMSYGQALVQEGVLDGDKPVTCALVYVDRSGKDNTFVAFEKTLDPVIIAEADDWITDVVYSVKHGEEASKDKPIDWCERFCEFFTVCRAADAAPEGGLIQDPDAIDAIDLYLEGQDLQRRGEKMKKEAKAHLEGVTGSTGQATVRWVQISSSEVPGYTRDGYQRLDVKPIKKGAK
jgi:hypothetical protein